MGRVMIYALVVGSVSLVTAGILALTTIIDRTGTAVVAGTVTTLDTSTVTSSTRFWVLFVFGILVLLVWAVTNYRSYPGNTPRVERLRGATPPVWAFAVLLGVTTFHWLFWAIGPGAWNAWLSSQTFWPMNAAIVLAAFFASQRGVVAGQYTSLALWALLLAAIVIGAYGYFGHLFQAKEVATPPSSSIPTTDTTFLVTVRPGQPAEVRMPPGWMIVWWGNRARFTSHAVWRGEDKVRVFSVRSGGESVEIKIHRYRDPDPNWWRRQ